MAKPIPSPAAWLVDLLSTKNGFDVLDGIVEDPREEVTINEDELIGQPLGANPIANNV